MRQRRFHFLRVQTRQERLLKESKSSPVLPEDRPSRTEDRGSVRDAFLAILGYGVVDMRLRIPLACFLFLIIAGCTGPVSKRQSGPPPVPSPKRNALYSGEVLAVPELPNRDFWAPDRPKQLEPLAFGILPPLPQVVVSVPRLAGVELKASLPAVPTEMPVFVAGVYPNSYRSALQDRAGLVHPDCEFVPAYAEVTCSHTDAPQGPTATIGDEADAERRAQELVKGLWMPDLSLLAVQKEADGNWQVTYSHGYGQWRIYSDRQLKVVLNPQGQLVSLIERRRPLMATSLYPVRSPQEAWEAVKSGNGFGLEVMWQAGPPRAGDHFVVRKVELAYVMPHVWDSKQLMPPYYVFWNEKRQALFVPAVVDAQVTWPVPQQ